ncbi:Ig-like domain-containing protein [Caloramator proteoclasticus]|uniref:SH3 domain-containing protein n=1 Tax=Caloramator proteoclasticus DSM 10124 TaxID=1121262 RepID=A0A1M4U4X1_9CLOT|nr:Ig-like domain-containing protein [Caloramator proteoclasticus]SHE51782.1 SH3 domain-containing protein [Caloramator proteoclasticus DSM 10124]
MKKIISKALLIFLLLFSLNVIPFTYVVANADSNENQTGNEKNQEILLNSIKFDVDFRTLFVGESFEIKVNFEPEDATNKELIWEVSNSSVVIIEDGKVTAVGVGEAIITAKSKENNDIKAECRVVVEPIKIKRITLNKNSLSLKLGEAYRLIATIEPNDATNKKVEWKSDNEKVVKVDGQGNVVALGIGKATIIAKSADEGLTASCIIDVKPPSFKDVEKKIVASIPTGVVINDTKIYKKIDKKKYIAKVKKSTNVRILDSNETWYKVKLPNGVEGWIERKYITVNIGPVLNDTLNNYELELYVNTKKFKSPTKYFIWVDIARQRTYVFSKDKYSNYKLEKNFVVATGRDVTPTIPGTYQLNGLRNKWIYFPQYETGVKYWVKIFSGYLFHSTLFAKDGVTPVNSNVGVKLSHGCIRMKEEDSYWVYKNIPSKTTIWIN